ncbi:DNA polymerase delta subunit 3 [Madurella mycetomatis]|uniref:DNA polymerase delta subunit 3 n=1 Tax=Madurella mycetomatis TaxID=100816 RepID=A0A175W0Q5_9PEZI|nr:DNA polymerase delta subunit 3 [Madurella mycetomatis]
MDAYSKFLAENVLTEDKVVTYRLLSRTLQVHVNTAKQMRNARAVHATYLVYGIKKAADDRSAARNGADGDIEMTSSMPEVESLSDLVPTFTLSLVPEEQLNEALSNYDAVSSIHIYSVGPHPTKVGNPVHVTTITSQLNMLQGLALLADAANQVLSLQVSDDHKNLAVIANPRARRRERKGAGVKAAAAATASVKAQTKPALGPAKVKEESKPIQLAQGSAERASSATQNKKPIPSSKRGTSSGIMQAFSKATTKVKKEAGTSQPATPSGDDSSVQPMSDDGEDDSEMPQPKPRVVSGSKSRKQREEELRRMMEEDDDDDDDDEEEASEQAEEEPPEEPMEEEPPAPEPAKPEESEIVTASTNGRRRGKRRVMRKKQVMDDQGYLVTIQEPGWESFSEDEPPPPTKPKTTSSTPATQAAKPKKNGPKGSQGTIMSFFSKK